MSKKFTDVHEDIISMFDEEMKVKQLASNVQLRVLADNDLKGLFTVAKANPVLNHVAGDDVVVVLNEYVFDELPDEFKPVVVESILAAVHFDFEKGKVVLTKPDVTEHSGILRKHGVELIERIRESVNSLLGKVESGEDA